MNTKSLLAVFTICVVQVLSADAQDTKPIPRGRVAWLLENAVTKAGSRFRQSGQQRWSAAVQVDGPTVMKNLSFTFEFPGKAALNGSGVNVVFAPGLAKRSAMAQSLSDAAEILVEDTLDGFLSLHLGGASTRITGSGYPDPYRPGNTCNVVVLRFNSTVLSDSRSHSKEYWFDTTTNRLVRVVHDSGREVLLGDYVVYAGNEFVGTLKVMDRGIVNSTITVAPFALGPALLDSLFAGSN